jgi:hypothetical protein
LPASLQGDEPEVDDEKGPRDDRESYRREKRFWRKRGSKSTSIMSTGNVLPVSTRTSPTSVTDRKSKAMFENNVASTVGGGVGVSVGVGVGDWQKIPKVEVVEHVDDDDEKPSGTDSPTDTGQVSIL